MNRNEKIYPFYMMFGYDYLFYLVISFLFLTITKSFSIGQVMYLSAFSAIFMAIFQIPANYIVEKIGLKKSIIIGNLFWVVNMIMTILFSNFYIFVIAEAICSLGTCLKSLSEPQLLYASLESKEKEKEFAKIEGKGLSWYYYLEAVSSVFVGFLFTINNYLPMIFTLTFGVIAFVTSIFFDDIKEYIPDKTAIKEYLNSFKIVLKSKRIISIFIYAFVMSGLVSVVDTLQKSVIVNLEVTAIEYSLIFAIITLCFGIGARIQQIIEKRVKRKTLTFIGYSYAILILLLGIFNVSPLNRNIALTISVVILISQNILSGSYLISIKEYMNNFTTSKVRGKIISVFYIFESIGKALLLFIYGRIISKYNINITSIILGIFSIIIIALILKFMKNKLGLNPEEYSEKEIFGMDISE